MFGSQTLELAVGLVFLYLLLALICSALNEWGAQMLSTRAQTLEEGIRTMLDDPEGTGPTAAIYDHPLIKSFTGKPGWFARLPIIRNWVRTDGKPSYIPSKAFALALMSSVMPGEGAAMTFDQFRAAVATLPNERLRGSLLLLVDEANGDLKGAQANIERWFNHCMERVSGWYKRRVRWVALAWAVIIALGLNADTLKIANRLWTDSTLRAGLEASAEAYVKQNSQTATNATPAAQESLQKLQQDVNNVTSEINKSKLPLGWTSVDLDHGLIHGFSQAAAKAGWRGGLLKLVGLLATALAVSLGAPFWFNLLKDLGALRSTGTPAQGGQTS